MQSSAIVTLPKSIRDVSRETLMRLDALVAERNMLLARAKIVEPRLDALVVERDMLRAALRLVADKAVMRENGAWLELRFYKQAIAALAKVQS